MQSRGEGAGERCGPELDAGDALLDVDNDDDDLDARLEY
jgi:hypothetical protein